jgi:hypothetical protein
MQTADWSSPPPGRTGMQSCVRCGDQLPKAGFIDLARRRQPFKLCPCCRPTVLTPAGFRSQYRPGIIQRHDLGRMENACRFCSALHWLAERDANSSLGNPLFTRCCKQGAVQLKPIQPPPLYLRWLLTSNDLCAEEFRGRIRQYNSGFAFTSISYTPDRRVEGAYKPFMVAGELFHICGPLEPQGGESPAFAQLWLLEDQQATIPIRSAMKPARGQQRPGANNEGGNRSALSTPVLAQLTVELKRYNPFIGIYKTAREQLVEAAQRQALIDVILSPGLRIILQEKFDPRMHNLPARTEVAAFIPNAPRDFGHRTYRDMGLTLRAPDTHCNALRRVDPSHAAYLPLHYVLLFPHGDTGWSWGLRLTFRDQDHAAQDGVDDLGPDDGEVDPPAALHNMLDMDADLEDNAMASGSDCITARQYHALRVFTRSADFNPIHHACPLGHQYCVDAYATIEQSQLRWLGGHQDDIQADTYQGLADHLAGAVIDAATEGMEAITAAPAVQRVMLPSSHIGSPRFMQKICQDAIALIRKLGPPTLFITMTANPT